MSDYSKLLQDALKNPQPITVLDGEGHWKELFAGIDDANYKGKQKKGNQNGEHEKVAD